MKAAKSPATMGQSGQNLIRVIIASYFIGVSVGLIKGTDATPLAAMFLDPGLAAFVGSASIFLLGYLVMTGIWLRFAALMLGLVIFWSSYITNLAVPGAEGVGDFWRDMTLIGALMLTYMRNSGRTTASFAMIRRKPNVRRLGAHTKIKPRRVATSGNSNVTRLPAASRQPVQRAEIENIFFEEERKGFAS